MAESKRRSCGWVLCVVFVGTAFQTSAQSSPTGNLEDPEKKAQEQKTRRKVYTNDDLIQLRDKQKEASSLSSNPENSDPSREKTGGKGMTKDMSLSGYRDLNGHDREYWRKKIKPLRTELDNLNSQIGALRQKQSENGSTAGIRVTRSGRLRASSKDNQQELARRLGDLERKRKLALKSIQDLEEEARKAQALPEWLR